MVSETEFDGPPTTSDLRKEVRRLIESEDSGGYYPLRKHEKHRAFYCLKGEKIDGDPSSGEVSYKLMERVSNFYENEVDLRDPWDFGGPFSHDELAGLVDALKHEAADEEVTDEG